MSRRALVLVLLMLAYARPPAAQAGEGAAPAEAAPGSEAAPPPAADPEDALQDPPQDPLHVYVMTMGPGDHPFFRFGHNAIWIKDSAAGTDRVYNFGTFKFDSPRLILDFLGGRLNYWLSVSSLDRVL